MQYIPYSFPSKNNFVFTHPLFITPSLQILKENYRIIIFSYPYTCNFLPHLVWVTLCHLNKTNGTYSGWNLHHLH